MRNVCLSGWTINRSIWPGAVVRFAVALCLVPFAVSAQEAPPVENLYSEYHATIVKVIDGDTLSVSVALWPGLTAEYSVRQRGIDAPELRRSACEEEREWAEDAQEQLERLYKVGMLIRLENVEYDVYSGRVVADIRRWVSDRWRKLDEEMIKAEMAVAWTPEMDDVPWCLLAKTRQE